MTKEKIKSASLHQFARYGYEGASLAEIAKQVGIKTPSIYAHFQGKEDLFLAVFEEVNWEIVQHVKNVLQKVEPYPVKEKIYHIFHETFRYYLENKEKSAFLMRNTFFPPEFLKDQLRTKFIDSEKDLSHTLAQIFTEGIEAGVLRPEKVESMLAFYYCLTDGLFIQIFYYAEEEVESRFEYVWNNFWTSISLS